MVTALEERVAALEAAGARAPRSAGGGAGRQSSGATIDVSGVDWTRAYDPAELTVSETWIELHEHAARPQLQRLIREVVEHESPVTDKLALDRVRRAWGIKRAGGRVQEAFEQSVRQLVARGLVERDGDALRRPGTSVESLRVPGEDEASRRGAEEVPLEELVFGIGKIVDAAGGSAGVDDATLHVAKLLGWTRRGGAIQVRFDAAIEHGVRTGELAATDGTLRRGAASGA